MPRRVAPRSIPALVFAAAIGCAPCGCAGSSHAGAAVGPWEDGLPRGEAAIVTIENLSYDPPRALGLVSEDHPAAKSAEAALRRSGIKRVPPDRMQRLLEALEDEGFLAHAAPLEEFGRADPRLVLRRLTITIRGERYAFTLPRGPSKAAAERFNRQALAVQAMFNETVDFRQEVGYRDPDYFYEVARTLFNSTAGERRAAGDGDAR